MSDEQPSSTVLDWFGRTGGGSLRLPNGWFGRPYDNLHQLTSAQMVDDRLVIVLDDRMILIVTGPVTAHVEPASLRLVGFNQAVWEWTENGSATPHTETFDTGEIEFVAH